MMLSRTLETIQRRDGARMLSALIRFAGNFERAEDALQEAFTRALRVWPQRGMPDVPHAWLTTVARNILVDDARRSHTSHAVAFPDGGDADLIAAQEAAHTIKLVDDVNDDLLALIFTCCHPALSSEAQAALALNTVCRLTVDEIARAHLEPRATTAQRLVRAKRKIAEAGIAFAVPHGEELAARLDGVLRVIYLVFNEGYATTSSPSLLRVDLCAEAIQLCTVLDDIFIAKVHRKSDDTHLTSVAEIGGLLTLMQFHHARRAARTDHAGELIALEAQDRALWHRAEIDAAFARLDATVLLRRPGAYQIEAAIAALHCHAATPAETDWPQIALLYRALQRYRANDVVALNAAVAHAMAHSLEQGIAEIQTLLRAERLDRYHLAHAALADLMRRAGRHDESRVAYKAAINLCTNGAERRYLERRLSQLVPHYTAVMPPSTDNI
jgi:RNA polymerase sigma-70 factor (ECF subfamily)